MSATDLTLEIADPIEPLAESWDELASRSSFGPRRLHIVVVCRGGRLVGLAPLEWLGSTLRAPTNAHTPEFDLLAVDEEATRALAERLFADGACTVTLEQLDPVGRSLEALRLAARATGYRAVARPLARAPYIRGGRSLAEHERSLGRNLRHDPQRRLRRLCEAGAASGHEHPRPSSTCRDPARASGPTPAAGLALVRLSRRAVAPRRPGRRKSLLGDGGYEAT